MPTRPATPQGAGSADGQPAQAADPNPWSPAQLVRLESEWRRLQRNFAYHPHVRVVPLAGDPPGEYQIDYKLRTLTVDAAGELSYVDACSVHIWIPPQFPHAPPVVRPMFAHFHPNVSSEWIHLDPPWHPTTGSLAQLVRRCGELLAFQIYDPEAVYNPTAMEWLNHYPHLLPTDPHADLAPEAGGDALGRVVRYGAHTLEQYRAQLTELSLGILEGRPNTGPADVRRLGQQVSLSTSLFSEPDVPDYLRSLASDLDEWARSMTPAHSIWDDLRTLYAQTRAADVARQEILASRMAIDKALRSLEGLVTVEPSADDPTETLARVPPVTKLDPVALALRKAVREAEQRLAGLNAAIEALSLPPLKATGTPGGPLYERTEADVNRGRAAAAAARQAAVEARAAAEPLLERARLEQRALDGIVAWAGFTDLIRRGNELKERLLELGVAGIQAYTIQAPSGEFGPYQFEERVDLGKVTLVARRIGAAPVQVYEARSTGLLGQGPGGVRIKIPGPDGKVYENVIRPTDHTDELRLQLNYLIKTSREHMQALGKADEGAAAAAAPSWAGRFSAALTAPPALAAAAEVHRRTSHRWMALLADLIDVGHLKERLATYHLFERYAEFVPAVRALQDKAEVSRREALDRLAYIAARSTRDVETDVLVVPPHFGRENLERIKQRDKAEQDLRRIQKLLRVVAGELQMRMAHPRLHGRPGVPRLRFLQPMPEGLAAMADVLTNAHLAARAAQLDALLGTRFAEQAPDPVADPAPAPATPPPETTKSASAAELAYAPAAGDAADAAPASSAASQSAEEARYAADTFYVAEEGEPDADPYAPYPSERLEGFVIDPNAMPQSAGDSGVSLGDVPKDERR
jgi:hypothetical protein